MTRVYKGNPSLPYPRPCGRKVQTDEEVKARAVEYRRLRAALDMPRADLSELTGLAISTLDQMPYEPARRVPSLEVLERMRVELARRTREGIAPAPRHNAEAAAADRDRRRREYVNLRRELAMSPTALASLLGLSANTVKLYPSWTTTTAPTDATLAKMRAELVRRDLFASEDAA